MLGTWNIKLTLGLGMVGVLLSGCGSVTGPGSTNELSYILHRIDREVHLDAPTQVVVGQPFTVTFRTYGLNDCWTKGGDDMATSDGGIVISPYDVHSGEENCRDILHVYQHSIELRIDQPGETELNLRGRDAVTDEEISVQRTIIAE